MEERREREEESEWDWTCSPKGRGTEAGVRSPHQTNSLGQKGGISGCWESEAVDLQWSESNVNHIDSSYHSPTYPRQEHGSWRGIPG